MNFNDTVLKSGIVQEIDSLCDSNDTSYPIADKTRRVNTALETLISKIINADGTWQFDDENFTTLPTGKVTLVEGQQSYSFTEKFLQVENVKILDKNGIYQIIHPIDQSQVSVSLESMFQVSGKPEFYDKRSDTIKLYPSPTATAVTLIDGMKVEYKRTGSLFVAGDTTKEPGIASPFHILLAWHASLPYNKIYHPERVPQTVNDIAIKEKEMLAHYARKEKDTKKVMRMGVSGGSYNSHM